MTGFPKTAMVLAAGLGQRMRPITDTLPKPLVPVRGRAMLDTILDRLENIGIAQVVINLYYLGEMIEQHLNARKSPPAVFSHEDDLLETGGGVRKALPLLGGDAFFALNGDVCWLDGHTPALERLAAAWDEDEMDALLLLHPTAFALGYEGAGDYVMDPEGRLRRRREREVAPFLYAGIQILHPRLFEGAPEGSFSLNKLYDKAQEAGRLWGIRHDGEWYHVGTPESLREVEDALHHLGRFSAQT
ncbi:nucleotidyltransferase family protein [Pelagibius litoralis]|uniref:Nucleotidyltransferase family protein n=1 Tax=Pelagibius litoralis TaxID=374515 RepID=A0A967C275_9PROT|nr:nucleotidyltransferase family protein [Pelagibius litoralis]NIA68003.1 nucleotidyltransferase family protein [Pelagibius litoralis]